MMAGLQPQETSSLKVHYYQISQKEIKNFQKRLNQNSNFIVTTA
jgi:hypothetical protein